MIDTKTMAIGALFAVIAALFQLIPALFSEVFVILTVFSSVPIFIVSRINPKTGILSYFVSSMLIMFLSVHEGLFFLLSNGIVGVSLGVCSYYTRMKSVTWFLSSIMLTITLSIMNYGIGIPVFGSNIPGAIITQVAIIFLFSMVYNIFYYYFSSFVFSLLKRTKLF